jgi:hypothetical protein
MTSDYLLLIVQSIGLNTVQSDYSKEYGYHQTKNRDRHSRFLSYLTGARYVHPWSILTEVSRTRSTVSADGPSRPVHFAAHRQPLCWNFM